MARSPSGRPEVESRELERYQVYSRVEVLALLRALLAQRVLVTLYFNRGDDFLVTSLLSVNPDFEELVFDASPDHEINNRVMASNRITAVAFVDNVKVQFSAGSAENTTFEREPAFRVRLPDSMLRLQRRDFFRVRMPITKPLKATATHPEISDRPIDVAVLDVACGGVGLLIDPDCCRVDPGITLENFQVELPEIGLIKCNLLIRHISDASKGTQKRYRLGCKMNNLPGPMATLVQRYVNKLERERLAAK